MSKKRQKLGDKDPLSVRLGALGVGEVLFELQAVGGSVRVSAIDPRSGVEVVAVCPASQSEEAMRRVAAAKLAYVLEKRRREADGDDGSILT